MRQLSDLFGKKLHETRFIRKRDGQHYWTNLKTTRFAHGDCIWLVPHNHGRSHWKSLAAFKAQYTNLDGSKIE